MSYRLSVMLALFIGCLLVGHDQGNCLAQKSGDAPAKLDPQLEKLATGLKSGTTAEQVNAARAIGALGKKGAPLARDLCAALATASGQAGTAILDALTKVRPDLAGSVGKLLSDDLGKQLQAAQELRSLRDKAAPAVPVLLAHLRKLSDSRLPPAFRTRLMQGDLEVIGQSGASDPATVKGLLIYAGADTRDPVLRGSALQALAQLVDMKPALAEQVLPAITAALDDTALQTAAIQAAARLGTEGKALVPALKKLQTSGPDAIRAAAADAGAVIELSLDAVPKTDPKKMSAADRRAWNIKRALLYLVKQQLPDGSWDSGMGANDQAILATTCWSALALMASGNTQYQSRIDQAATFVGDHIFKKDDSGIALPPEWDQSNWKIGIGGLFLAEYHAALVQRGDKEKAALYREKLDTVVEEAFKRMEASGGWGHTPRIKCPLGYVELEIVSNWMLAALGACQRQGAKLPDDKVKQAVQFVQDCCATGKGAVGYSPRQGQKGFGCPCRTGGAIFAFAVLGKEKHVLYPRMVTYYKQKLTDSGEGHGSVAMGFLASALGARQVGADTWKKFTDKFFPIFEAAIQPDGSFKHLVGKTVLATGFDHKMSGPFQTGHYALILQLDKGNLRYLGRKP